MCFFPYQFRHVYTFSLTKVKNINHRIVAFDSFKEASWCTDCNAKKTELLVMDHFWKKLGSFCRFSWFISKFIMFIGCFNAYMKCHDPLSSFQQNLAVFYEPFLEKIWKNCKQKRRKFFCGIFYTIHVSLKKNGPLKWVLVFCISINASRRFF